MKTKVGVKIFVINEGNNKILTFDQPVQTIELSLEESKRLGSWLIDDDKFL